MSAMEVIELVMAALAEVAHLVASGVPKHVALARIKRIRDEAAVIDADADKAAGGSQG